MKKETNSTDVLYSVIIPVILNITLAVGFMFFLRMILSNGYNYDNNTGEPSLSHPLVTLLWLFGVWSVVAIGNKLILRVFSSNNVHSKVENFQHPPPFWIVACVCLYLGFSFFTIELTKRVFTNLQRSIVTGQYFIEHPVCLQFEYLAIFVVFIILLVTIIQFNSQKIQNVPKIVSIFSSVLNACGFHSVLTWASISSSMVFLSLKFYMIWYLFISLLTFVTWFDHRLQMKAGFYDHLQSFSLYLMNLFTFLTRLTQVILVFVPFYEFNVLESHMIYVILLICFGNRDAYLGACAAKTRIWSRCGCVSSDNATDSSPKLTWCQYLSGCVYNFLSFLLALYQMVWVIMLILPGLHSMAMNNSPGRLTLRILSIWNLLSFLYVFAKSHSTPVLALAAGNVLNDGCKSSSAYAYQPLKGDVEMCAPAAVVVHENQKEDKSGVMGVL